MEELKIQILNPKVKKVLQNLADLNLIKIQSKEQDKEKFLKVVEQVRSHNQELPTEEEIQNAVEDVRAKRYERKSQDRS